MYPWVDSLHWTLFKEAVWFLTKLFFVFEILNILGGEAAKSQLTLKITVEIDPFSVQVKFRGHGLNPIIIKLILVTMTKFYTYQFIALNNICLTQCKHKRWCLSWINLPQSCPNQVRIGLRFFYPDSISGLNQSLILILVGHLDSNLL